MATHLVREAAGELAPGLTRGLRILVVGVSWPPETFILRRLRGLAEAGFEVIVGTPDPVKGPVAGNIRVFELPKGNRSGLMWRLASAVVRALARSVRETVRFGAAAWQQGDTLSSKLRWLGRLLPLSGLRPDIVHFEWNFGAVAYLPLFDLLSRPVVISCRGSQVQVATHNPDRYAEASQLRLTFEKAAVVHCVSAAIRDEAVLHGLDSRKAAVIRPAVDPEFFCPPASTPASGGLLRIATTGSAVWIKGYEYALLAVRQLLDRGVAVRFDIIGHGDKSDWQRLLYTIEDLKLTGVVCTLGKQPPERVREILREAHVFLLSSLSEGISNAALEAMACGLPVVTTDCGGMREAVTAGVEGFVVPVRSPESMAQALETLARHPEMRQRMGKAARERVIREFTLDEQVAAWVSLYSGLAAGRRRVTSPGTLC